MADIIQKINKSMTMSWVVVIIAAVVLLFVRKLIFSKIDEDEKKALKTPGKAFFLRNHYQDVISHLESKSDNRVLFERNDAIKIGNTSQYYHLSQDMGRLTAVFIRNGQLVKEWHFKLNDTTDFIIGELSQV